MLELLPQFLPAFFTALAVNFGIALCAVAGGLLAGLPLAACRLAGRWPGSAAGALVALLRAAPTFVVMFFLLNALPASVALGPWSLWGPSDLFGSLGPWDWTMTPWLAVVLSLALYATAYVSDNALDAMQQWRAGAHGGALLFLMGLVRAFFVMVLSSGFGAAVGVTEATSVTLRAIDSLPELGDRLALMAVVMAIFVAIFQSIYAAIDALRRHLLARWQAAPFKPG